MVSVLVLVARSGGYVRLAVDAEVAAVGVEHRQRIVVRVVGPLEEADRQHDLQLGGQRRHAGAQRVALGRLRQREVALILVAAEVGRLEEQIGSASSWARGCQSVKISVVAVELKKKQNRKTKS